MFVTHRFEQISRRHDVSVAEIVVGNAFGDAGDVKDPIWFFVADHARDAVAVIVR